MCGAGGRSAQRDAKDYGEGMSDPVIREIGKAMETIADAFRCEAVFVQDGVVDENGVIPRSRCILQRDHGGMHVNEGGWSFEEEGGSVAAVTTD